MAFNYVKIIQDVYDVLTYVVTKKFELIDK